MESKLIIEMIRQRDLIRKVNRINEAVTSTTSPWLFLVELAESAAKRGKNLSDIFTEDVIERLSQKEINSVDDLRRVLRGEGENANLTALVRRGEAPPPKTLVDDVMDKMFDSSITRIFNDADLDDLTQNIVGTYMGIRGNTRLQEFTDLILSYDPKIPAQKQKIDQFIAGLSNESFLGKEHPVTKWFERQFKKKTDQPTTTKTKTGDETIPPKTEDEPITFNDITPEESKALDDVADGSSKVDTEGVEKEPWWEQLKSYFSKGEKDTENAINDGLEKARVVLCKRPEYKKLCENLDDIVNDAIESMRSTGALKLDPISQLKKVKQVLDELSKTYPELTKSGFWQNYKMVWSAVYKLERGPNGMRAVPHVWKSAGKWGGVAVGHVAVLFTLTGIFTFLYWYQHFMRDPKYSASEALGAAAAKSTFSIFFGTVKGIKHEFPDANKDIQTLAGGGTEEEKKLITKQDAEKAATDPNIGGYTSPLKFDQSGDKQTSWTFTDANNKRGVVEKDKDNNVIVKRAE